MGRALRGVVVQPAMWPEAGGPVLPSAEQGRPVAVPASESQASWPFPGARGAGHAAVPCGSLGSGQWAGPCGLGLELSTRACSLGAQMGWRGAPVTGSLPPVWRGAAWSTPGGGRAGGRRAVQPGGQDPDGEEALDSGVSSGPATLGQSPGWVGQLQRAGGE